MLEKKVESFDAICIPHIKAFTLNVGQEPFPLFIQKTLLLLCPMGLRHRKPILSPSVLTSSEISSKVKSLVRI